MRVLITGGAGFIGSTLAIFLSDRGDEVTILDNLSPQIHGPNPLTSPLFRRLPRDARVVVGDVRDREAVVDALSGVEVVVHLAAETGTGQSMYEMDRYVDINARGTALLLDVVAANEPGTTNVRKIVVASSRSIYGEGKHRGVDGQDVYPDSRSIDDLRAGVFECRDPRTGDIVSPLATDEAARIHPSSIYGITKQVQEQLVLTATGAIGIQGIALRYQNVYGPGQSLKNPYTGILSIFSTQLLQGEDVNVFEDGGETRDFVYVDDAVRATVAAIDSDVSGTAYNVGTGKPTDVLTVANTLRQHYNSDSRIQISGNFRVGDIRHNHADLTRVRADLGFAPQVEFDEGIGYFTRWVRSQEIGDIGYDDSVAELRRKGLLQ